MTASALAGGVPSTANKENESVKKLVTMAVIPAVLSAGVLVATAQDRPGAAPKQDSAPKTDRQGDTPRTQDGTDRQGAQGEQGGFDRHGAGMGVQVGEAAPNFIIQDIDGDTHNLREYVQDGKIVVLEWFDPLSPFSRKYHEQSDGLQTTYERFEDKDVIWLAVATYGMTQGQGLQGPNQGSSQGNQGFQGQGQGSNRGAAPGQTGTTPGQSGTTPGQSGTTPGQSGQTGQTPTGPDQPGNVQGGTGTLGGPGGETSSLAGMTRDRAIEALKSAKGELNIGYPILLDESGNLAHLYGVREVPHVFIINKDGRIAYHGAIDNSRGIGQAGDVNYVAQALQQIVDNQPVSVPRSEPFGTSLPASAPRQGDEGMNDRQGTTPTTPGTTPTTPGTTPGSSTTPGQVDEEDKIGDDPESVEPEGQTPDGSVGGERR